MKHPNKRDDETAWYWYETVQKFLNEGTSPADFCAKHDIQPKKFCDYKFAILNISLTDPDGYKSRKEIYDKYKSSGLKLEKFASLNNTKSTGLKSWKSHFEFIEQIENIKKEKKIISERLIGDNKNNGMNFIQMPSINNKKLVEEQVQPNQELLQKQNDLEINVPNGVKVIISSKLDNTKIIKIVDFLRML